MNTFESRAFQYDAGLPTLFITTTKVESRNVDDPSDGRRLVTDLLGVSPDTVLTSDDLAQGFYGNDMANPAGPDFLERILVSQLLNPEVIEVDLVRKWNLLGALANRLPRWKGDI
jgi:hypothetical protein